MAPSTALPKPIIPLGRILATLDRMVATQRNMDIKRLTEDEHDDLREAARMLREGRRIGERMIAEMEKAGI
jgi:hypothetical protein